MLFLSFRSWSHTWKSFVEQICLVLHSRAWAIVESFHIFSYCFGFNTFLFCKVLDLWSGAPSLVEHCWFSILFLFSVIHFMSQHKEYLLSYQFALRPLLCDVELVFDIWKPFYRHFAVFTRLSHRKICSYPAAFWPGSHKVIDRHSIWFYEELEYVWDLDLLLGNHLLLVMLSLVRQCHHVVMFHWMSYPDLFVKRWLSLQFGCCLEKVLPTKVKQGMGGWYIDRVFTLASLAQKI